MEKITIYHNPKCSKSRQTLKLIQNHGLDPIIIEYLNTPLDIKQLKNLSTHFLLYEFVRSNEPLFKELGLSLEEKESIFNAMAKEPILMQRPIVTHKSKAIIGRPPEKVLELLD